MPMDQPQPITSTLSNSQTVPLGSSISSMPVSVQPLKPDERMRFIEPIFPSGTGPHNVSLNGSTIYMMPKTINTGFQQMDVPNSHMREMGAFFNNNKPQHIQLPIKRKTPMENLSGYPISPRMAMPKNNIGQQDHRPWFNTLASRNNVQHQMQFAAGAPIPQQLTAQTKRTTQIQDGPLKSGSSTPRTNPIHGQPSPKVQNQSNEPVRCKLRESISAALALVTEKEKPSGTVVTSSSASAITSEKMHEGSQSTDVAPSVSNAELTAEKLTETSQDPQTPTENILKSELSIVDCDIGGSLQINEGVGQGLDIIDLLPDEGGITDNVSAKDDLLLGNGLAWVLDFDAWIAEKEGRDPMKQKVSENVDGAREAKKTASPQNLAFQIELELFKLFGGVNKKYKEKGRSLLFNLKDKNNPELREKVMSGEISPARLCSMSAEELASKELSEWRIAKAEEFDQMKILPDSDIDIRRLVKKTHKGDIEVEVEEDDVSVEVSVGSITFPQIQTDAKKSKPQSDPKSNAGRENTMDDNRVISEEQNLQCTITIPSNENSDLMQGLIEDEMKDAEFLPPIVSLDEFMESLNSEPPFENSPPNKIAASPDDVHTEVPSESKLGKLSPDGHRSAATDTLDSLDTEQPKVDAGIKPTNNQPHADISPPIVLSRGEHIWEGLLQLSISSTIAVNGFFKSGEKASTNDWPRTIEIKGRVRLNAFEKFLQDLNKSQSRSIMVMHVILKEDKETEALSQVVDSYVADDRVGFAEPLRGLEVYLCPCHPKILDRIEKHLVKDQTEAITLTGDEKGLIGVIVSRKAASPNSSSHHKHGFKNHQQEHYTSRRHKYHQDRNINVNATNLKPKYPLVPLVSTKANYSALPVKAETDEDDLPPGFGPRASQEVDDLPEFNFSGELSRSGPTQRPIGWQINRPTDQMRQLVQKYGQTAATAGSGLAGKHWKDEENDIPEWQPQLPLSSATQSTPPQLNYQPLNQPMLQHLINQQQLQRSALQQPQAHVHLQPPMSVTQHPGLAQNGVWLNPHGPHQGQFYGAHSRGF